MSTLENPYEWPFPQRTDLMAFQTINNSKKQLYQSVRGSSLNVADIEGTQPQMKQYRYTNKESYNNRVDDIEGTKSKQLIRTLNRPDNQLYLDDIKGTKPKINKFETNRAPSNPLEPVYKIPTFAQAENYNPKFLRDSYQVHDIEGAQPLAATHKLKQHPIELEDVKGSHPKQLHVAKDYLDSLQVKDINEYMFHKKTRITNPITPTYDHIDEDGKKVQIGFVQGSTSKQLHPKEINKVASSILTTQDIVGAQAGTHADYFLRTKDRKDYRNTNNVADIEGVSAGSLKKGIVSKRYINPLMPAYQMPGNSEIYNPQQSVFQKNASSQVLSTAQKMDQFIKQ